MAATHGPFRKASSSPCRERYQHRLAQPQQLLPPMSPKKKLKVVTLVKNFGPGGAENVALATTIGLDPDRFDRAFCATRWGPGAESDPVNAAVLAELSEAGVRFLGLERGATVDLLAWRPLLRMLKEERVDVLHAHMFGSNVWATLIGGLARTPVIVAHEHTWSFDGKPLRKLLDRELIARRSAAMIAVSEEDRRKMIEIEGIDADEIVVIPNGIPPLPAPSGRDLRRELGLESGAPVIGTVCVLRAQKALWVLLRAAAILRGEFPGLQVLIVGEGGERARIEALISELGLSDTVRLLGRRTDIADILPALDLAVCSSDYEGSPLSILEYMDAGKAVVSTAVGGVPDLIEDGVHGLLVEPRDPDAFAAAVATLLRDPERAREMGEMGRQRRHHELGIDRTVARLESLYEELYARSSAAGSRG